jgi:ABC-type nitrate/sulfonate/bicarbonate transport system ATPase subunit
MTASPLIRFRGVGKSYARGTVPVLDGIDLDVAAGELVALIGPSGCGKSTLLNLLAGLTDVTTGRIELAAGDLRSAYVFQHPRLLPWRQVRRNVEFGLEQTGLDAADRRARAQQALELVHLGDHGDSFPHQLSGGMQQRVALARGLALAPGLLLLDEPFSALDALTRSCLQEELLAIVRCSGTTTLLVTHDIDEALLLADRIVVLAGRPAQIRCVVDIPFQRISSLDELMDHEQFGPLRRRIRALLRPTAAASDPTIDAHPSGLAVDWPSKARPLRASPEPVSDEQGVQSGRERW